MNYYNCSICDKAYSTTYLKLIVITDNKLEKMNINTPLLMSIHINTIWNKLNARFPEVEDNNKKDIKYKLWESVYIDDELNSCVCRINK